MDEEELSGDGGSIKIEAREQTLGGSGDGSSDDSSSGSDDADDTTSESDSKTTDKSKNPSDSEDSSSGSDEEEDDTEGEGSASDADKADTDGEDSSDETKSDNKKGSEGNPKEAKRDPKDSDLDADEVLEEDLEIDQEMLDDIKKEIMEEESKIEKAERAESTSTGELPSFDVESQYFDHVTVLNRRVKNASVTMKAEYNALVSLYNWEIKTLTKALEKIFSADKEESVRSTSGAYNIKRGTIGCTARIMDKRRDPANKKDACVCLCIDLSGSMCGSGKIDEARKTAIVMAEALRKLNIPYYIMGFRADIDGATALHEHFVTWDGKGRETLAVMRARGNNFDGYSIRYASNLLKTRPESNKIMFIISDGEPACYSYASYEAGITDTYQAVKESRKASSVFGIALGKGCNPEVIQNFYGKDFIFCEDEKLLTNTLAKKLVKQFK